MGITSVDPAALRAAALRMDTAADIVLGILRAHLADLRFDAVAAGRDYGADRYGDAESRAVAALR
jgi:hypothetical protein